MSPTGRPLTATSYESDDSRGDEFEDAAAEARGADSYGEGGAPHANRLGLLDDLLFDPVDQEVMQQQDQMQLIVQMQEELAELKRQLATRSRAAPSMSDTSMETAPPSPKKPKIKDVRCSNFKGNEVYPGLGAGFENFIHEFEHAIKTEELVNGSIWTDELKASVIVNFLEGKASRYYHKKNCEWQRRNAGRSMPYADVKRAMRAEFGCKLSQLELAAKMQCRKREGDSWHEYLEYLNFIEGLMEGDQSKMVMEVFGNHACPELAPTLLSSVPDDADDYLLETDRMKRLLYKLKGDGRRYGAKRDDRKGRKRDKRNLNSHDDHSRRQNEDRHGGGYWRNQRKQGNEHDGRQRRSNDGEAFAAAGQGQIHCHVCGKPGHKIFTCPLVEQAKRLAASGSANLVAATASDSEGSNDSDEEAYIWMAASQAEPTQSPAAPCTWTVDSGASHHLCNDRDQLFAIEPALLSIKVANGNSIAALEKGSTIINTYAEGVRRTILLKDVYYAEGVDRNLISVAQLTKRGYVCEFGEKCIIRTKTGKVVAEVARSPVDGLWSVGIDEGTASFASMTTSTLQKWHERLGHINFQALTRMLDKKLANDMTASNRKVDFCMSCAEAKQTRRARNQHDTSTSAPTDEPGATLCVDLKVDMVPDRVGHKHMLTIVDHATNYNRVYLLRKKSEAETNLEDFISEFERQFDAPVKVLRSDGGGEFGSTRLDRFLRNRGIRHQLTERDRSSSNGKAERFHRTVMDSARAMLWASALPKRFWGDAVLYASYIRNYLPTRANADHASPIEALTGKVPGVSHILRFGAKCTSHIAHAARKSAKKRAEKGVIIGVDPQKKAYHVFIPRTKRIISTTHVQNIDRLDPRAVGRYMDAIEEDHDGNQVQADAPVSEPNTPATSSPPIRP